MQRLALEANYFILLLIGIACFGAIGAKPVYAGSLLTWDSIDQMIQEKFPEVQHMYADQLVALLKRQEAEKPLLLDARESEEYEVSHIHGAVRARKKKEALKILEAHDKDSLIVIYCSVGYRSSSLAEKLQKKGFTKVYNLKGSIFKWVNEGHMVYRGDRQVAVVHPFNEKWGQLLEKRFWSESLE